MSTLTQKVIWDGFKIWDSLEHRYGLERLRRIVSAFFGREPVRNAAKSLGLTRSTVTRLFRTFQAFIANTRWKQAIHESKGARRVTLADVQTWMDEIAEMRGRPVFPWFCFTFNGENFRIDWLERIATQSNPKVPGRFFMPHGMVVTDMPRSSATVRHRSVHLFIRDSRLPREGEDKSISPYIFGNDLLEYLRKFKGIQHDLVFDCLLEFEWKAALKRHWLMHKHYCSESEHHFSFLRKAIRETTLEF